MVARLVFLVIIIFFLWLYIRYFELRSIYYPTRTLEATPADIGLTYEEVNFRSGDRVELNGWFIPSPGARATLLFCHGNAGNISHRLEFIDIFRRMGLDVFIFDYRGYGRSRGRPGEKGTYLDGVAAYCYLVSQKGAAPEKIVVYGESLGGAIAIYLAEKLKVGALICEGTFTSTVDMGREVYPFLPIKLMVTMKYEALSRIGGVKAPTLIVHSQDDEIVPFRHGQRLYEAAGGPKEFYRMRGGHNEAVFLARDEFSSRIESFLTKYLP